MFQLKFTKKEIELDSKQANYTKFSEYTKLELRCVRLDGWSGDRTDKQNDSYQDARYCWPRKGFFTVNYMHSKEFLPDNEYRIPGAIELKSWLKDAQNFI